jgi:hypothetical protein
MVALAQDQDVDARPRQLYRCPKARRARADDQYVGFHELRGVADASVYVILHVCRLSRSC